MRLIQLPLLRDKSLLSLNEITEVRALIPTQTKQIFILGYIRDLLFLLFEIEEEKYCAYVVFDTILNKIILNPINVNIESRKISNCSSSHAKRFFSFLNRLAIRYNFHEIEKEKWFAYMSNFNASIRDGFAPNIILFMKDMIDYINEKPNDYHSTYYVKLINKILDLTIILCSNSKCEKYLHTIDYEIEWDVSCPPDDDERSDRRYFVSYYCDSCGWQYATWVRINEDNAHLTTLVPPTSLRGL